MRAARVSVGFATRRTSDRARACPGDPTFPTFYAALYDRIVRCAQLDPAATIHRGYMNGSGAVSSYIVHVFVPLPSEPIETRSIASRRDLERLLRPVQVIAAAERVHRDGRRLDAVEGGRVGHRHDVLVLVGPREAEEGERRRFER